ncbi:hypothetical protein H6P81_015671 [Aristolochia fimbriata]|uniref:non-specific serine/threonine protein kinase n=1 Tax=Aristolochia fimbriata TaxID=158543 RepID=A0AAV7E977_ARIFI|nr:hypothetical protein H6P81_015671 [Aristolochia fimbriata]
MDFSNRIYNQATIDYSQSRKIPIKNLSPESRKNGKASTKEWVLKSFYGRPKAALDTPSTSAAPNPEPSPSRTRSRVKTPARKSREGKGEPSIHFPESLVNSRAEKFKYCLVGRFPGSRPPLALIREWFGDHLKLRGEWSVTLLDRSHVFVRLENQEDMVHVWATKRWFIKGSLMKVFKWSPLFRTSDREDPSLAAIWVSFPSLPVLFFQEEFLYSISALVGKVLTMDGPTRKLTRTNVARVCVEVDLLQELPQSLWIGIGARGFWQDITYENLPSYCAHCLLRGHSITRCSSASKDAKQRSTPKSSLKLPGAESHDEQLSQGKNNFRPPVSKGQRVSTHNSVRTPSEVLPKRASDDDSRKSKDRGGSRSTRKQTNLMSVSDSSGRTRVVSIKKENVPRRKNDRVETCAAKVIRQKRGGSSDQSNRNENSERLPRGRERAPKPTANWNSSNSLISKRSQASRGAASANRFFFWKRRSKQTKVVERISEVIGGFGLKQYKYSEIKQITRSFSDVLGRGGFGTVHKGTLPNGRIVAVKVSLSLGGEEEFVSEVEIIGRTYHVNIVRLLGFCSDRSHRALVYEYIPRGSLERFIHAEEGNRLEWGQLLEIAIGVARGLQYLHQGCNICIVHSDIKPRNILLDEFYCPKISDFGLARAWGGDSTKTTYIRGTRGYIAPEHLLGERGTSKSDVYSYGVLLLEMAVRRSPVDREAGNHLDRYLPDWVRRNANREPGLELGGIAGIAEGEEARKMVMVGLWCVRAEPEDRPSMNEVVKMLEGRVDELQMPPEGGNAYRWQLSPPVSVNTLRSEHVNVSQTHYSDTSVLEGR